MWKRLGKILAKPVTVPAKLIEKGAERTMLKIIAKVIARHGLTAVGGSAAIFSDSDIEQAAGLVAALLGLLWSAYEKRRDAKQVEAAKAVIGAVELERIRNSDSGA